MSKRKWLSGPPPSVGWWNASDSQAHFVWRWWNGHCWSTRAHEGNNQHEAALAARIADWDQVSITYTTYWPKNARVARPT